MDDIRKVIKNNDIVTTVTGTVLTVFTRLVKYLDFFELYLVYRVFSFGAKKYKAKGYHDVPAEKYNESLKRHYQAWLDGETRDKESGLHPLLHILANALILAGKYYREKYKKEAD